MDSEMTDASAMAAPVRTQVVIAGHVDDGKSTIVGRLLADAGALPDGKLEQVRAYCERTARVFEYAFLVDALQDERAQGVTIDAARVFFRTTTRQYVLIDAPGHVEFLKNMITGAAPADAALLVVDAREGVRETSRRHATMLAILGVRQIALLLNKMDLVGHAQARFDAVAAEMREVLARLGLTPVAIVPVAGREGENIVARSAAMPWYTGPTVLDLLHGFSPAPPPVDTAFRMPVQGVYKFTSADDDRRIVAGTIESGRVRVGDVVVFHPSGLRSRVQSIEAFNAPVRMSAGAGEATGFTLDPQVFVSRGDVAVRADEAAPQRATRLRATLFCLGRRALDTERSYLLKLGTARVPARIERIDQILDDAGAQADAHLAGIAMSSGGATGTTGAAGTAADARVHRSAAADGGTFASRVERHQIAQCVLHLQRPLAFDRSSDIPAMSRFALVDDYEICGGGILRDALPDEREPRAHEPSSQSQTQPAQTRPSHTLPPELVARELSDAAHAAAPADDAAPAESPSSSASAASGRNRGAGSGVVSDVDGSGGGTGSVTRAGAGTMAGGGRTGEAAAVHADTGADAGADAGSDAERHADQHGSSRVSARPPIPAIAPPLLQDDVLVLSEATLAHLAAIGRQAGAAILTAQGGPVAHKQDGSPVTRADMASHELLCAALAAWEPSIPIISEETCPDEIDEARRGWRRFWLVDPLDGTKEFAAGRDDYVVCLALIEDGAPVMSVVHAPARRVLYRAANGLGTWRESADEPRTRIFAHPPPAGAGLRVIESRSHPSPALEAFLAGLSVPVASRTQMGSALKFAWLAEGRVDCYPRLGETMAWDVAAGDGLFRNAVPAGASRHASPLTYNAATLRQPPFVLGFVPIAPAVVWLTGLPAAGKSTLANALCARLRERTPHVELLDGDALREIFPHTGFTREARDAHVCRVGHLASRLEHHGVISVAALVSPYRDARAFVRGLCRRFIEVHVSTPLAICEQRDPKGLYARARAGEARQITGVDDPYEPPEAPDLTLDLSELSLEDAVARLLRRLEEA